MRGLFTFLLALLAVPCLAADLTGNWAVLDLLPDGTFRATYLDLHQEGSRITGTIRAGQFYFKIVESAGETDGFTLTGSMLDGTAERRVKYEGRLVGDELHLATRRRPEAEITEMIAHRVPAGQGAYPPRRPLPELHQVADNNLARTPPMGWNSWNKFAGRVDDPAVRGMADAMARNGMKDVGYQYINIDDTWEAGRDAQGNIHSKQKIP
jgi:alpha-galactosidase